MTTELTWIFVGQWSVIMSYFAGRLFQKWLQHRDLRRRERELTIMANLALDMVREEMGENPLFRRKQAP